MSLSDDVWMGLALELAERGRGFVEPNPLVGAVVVRAGELLGQGWHQTYGQAHAEVNALNEAGAAARGATLYVTLEPCCHHGKTPPCTEAVLRAGIARVVAAVADPFPQVAGQGFAQLRAAGVAVEVGARAAQAERQNAPYRMLLAHGRPQIHAKWAMTLDGKIATRTGASQWISNSASRRKVHELRGRMDAIVVGIGTALADDPLLTARPPGPRVACRVVLDRQARLPLASQLVRTARDAPTLIVTVTDAAARLDPLRAAGCEVFTLTPADDLAGLLREFGRRRWTNVLVEGGGAVLGSFLDAGLIDEVHAFIAPRLIGGASAKGPIAGLGSAQLADALSLIDGTTELLDGDVYFHGRRGVQSS